jgi:hypothetical protein
MVILLGLLGCYGWALAQAEQEDAHGPVPDGSAAIPHAVENGIIGNPVTEARSASEWETCDLSLALRVTVIPHRARHIRLAGLPLQTQQPLLLRLKPQDRARVLAALAALVILGFALVALAWWGARYTRRYLKRPWPHSERHRSGTSSEFDWAQKPLYDAPSDEEEDADMNAGDRRGE